MTTPKPPGSKFPDPTVNTGARARDAGVSERPAVTSRSIPVIDVASELGLGELEFDPDDVLASLVPYDEPSSISEPTPQAWPLQDERQGQAFLEELNLVEEFQGIANRLAEELDGNGDDARRFELAACASEVLAIAGATTEALFYASRAVAASPKSRIARLQVRHLNIASANYSDIPTLVAEEISLLEDACSKAQMRLWQSEFMRLIVGDAQTSREVLASANSEFPMDSQVSLLRLLEALADDQPLNIESLELRPLSAADYDSVRTLARIRGSGVNDDFQIDHPAATMLDAANALSDGDVPAAARRLNGLLSIPDCEPAIRWLRASLMAASPDTRSEAIHELLRLQQLESDPEVYRALLERSIESNDLELTSRLLERLELGGISNSIPVADLLVLAHWASRPSQGVHQLCAAMAGDPAMSSLVAAVLDLNDPGSNDFPGLDPNAKIQLVTARQIAMTSPTQTLSLPVGHERSDESEEFLALDFTLRLEQAYEGRDACALGRLFQEAPDSSGPWSAGDRESLAALFFEAAHEPDSAQAAWQLARTAKCTREAAVRAALGGSDARGKQSILEQYVEELELQDDRVPWLLLEAALLVRQSNGDEAQRLLEHAHAISPDLTFLMTLGEDLARNSGNRTAAVDWLSKRAELADDATESALLAAQEALLLIDTDALAAETCAIRAIEYAPEDVTLRVLRDRVAAASSSGEWRGQSGIEVTDKSGIDYQCQAAARSAWLGEWRIANDAVLMLAQSEKPSIAELWAEQAAADGQRNPKLFEKLFSKARTETDSNALRELYERLARVDPNAGTDGNSDLWLNAIIEREPGNLAALRGLERSAIRRGRWLELATIAEKLMQQLDRNEALGYCWLASSLHTYTGNWLNGEHLVNWAARQQPTPLWALRRQLAFALAKGDWATANSIQSSLAERPSYAGDATALILRTAESAKQLQQWDEATTRLKAALEITPDHVVALSLLAAWQIQRGELGSAADGFEQLAQACADPGHKESALSRAAELWTSVRDESRAEFALEQLLTINPRNSAATQRLSQIYKGSNAYDRLAALIERQLEYTQVVEERAQLQVERARCLLALDLTIAADKALEPALHAFPDNIDALEVKADIAVAVDDRHEAEFTYTRLIQLATEPIKQAELYRKLGALYERSKEQADAAETAYQRLLQIIPSDSGALSALVRLCVARGDTTEAIRLQTKLVDSTEDAQAQRLHLIELSKIYETGALDRRRAEELLEKARRKWQNDSVLLRAFAEFYQRAADGAALQVLLERSTVEARRALHTGRFEVAFFEVLATVAALRDQQESAQVAEAVANALRGAPTELPGVGLIAADTRFDEVLAPELLNLPLRAMLQRTGWALDAASPYDLRTLQIVALSDAQPALFDHVQDLASHFDLMGLSIWVSPTLGHVCIPVQSRPPVLVIGRKLLENEQQAVQDFLLIRAMKTLQTHTACLARAAAVDLWPLLAAYLGVLLPDWQPTGVDARRLEDTKQTVRNALGNTFTHDTSALAQDVVVALGNRASQVGEAVNEWGSRTALMALGNPANAIEALALGSSTVPLPKDGVQERVKWINRHPEVRNLAIFAVSDGFLQLRSQLLRPLNR